MRTITITDLRAMRQESWTVRDDSPRGMHVAYTSEIVPGDRVIIDSYITTVIDDTDD